MNLPLPPKNAEVVQKLHPMGQPTEGMMVAAVSPFRCRARLMPMVRGAEPGNDMRMADGRLARLRPDSARIQEMPSPFTMWSASIICSMPGMAATCPPTTIAEPGDKLPHHAAHLAHLADVHDDATRCRRCRMLGW